MSLFCPWSKRNKNRRENLFLQTKDGAVAQGPPADGIVSSRYSGTIWQLAGILSFRQSGACGDGDLNSRARGSQAYRYRMGVVGILLHFGRSRRLGSVRDRTRDQKGSLSFS